MSEILGNGQSVEAAGKLTDNLDKFSDKLEAVKTGSGALEILFNKKINKTFDNFTKILGNNEEQFNKLIGRQNSAVKTGGKLRDVTGDFNKELAKSDSIFAKLFKTTAPIVKLIEKFIIGGLVVKGITVLADGVGKINKELKGVTSALSVLEKSGADLSELYGLQQFGDDISSLNTAGIEDFATTAVSKFTEVSTLLARIGTLIPQELNEGLKKGEDVLGQYFEKYQNLVDTQLKNTVTSTEALQGAYTALQAGFTDAEVDTVVGSSLKLLVAQGGDAEQIVALLKQTMTAFGLEAKDAGDILGKLNKTVDLGLTTIPELQYGFGSLGVSASTAGVSLDEMAASLVQLTNAGSTTFTATTKLNNLYNQITSGQITERLKAIGATYVENGQVIAATFDSQTIAAKGFAKAADDVFSSLGKSNQKLREILPDSEAFSGFAGIMKEGATELQSVIDQIANTGAAELEKAFKIRIDNDKVVQFGQVVNKVTETVLKLGRTLAPLFDAGIDAVDALVDKLEYLVKNYGAVVKAVVAAAVAFNAYKASISTVISVSVALLGTWLQFQLVTGKLFPNIVQLVKAFGDGGGALNKYNMLWDSNVSITKKVLGSIGQLIGAYDIQKDKVNDLTSAEREALTAKLEGIKKNVEGAKQDVANNEAQVAAANKKIASINKQIEATDNYIKVNKKLTDSQQAANNQRKELLRQEIAAAQKEIKARQDKIDAIEKEIAAGKKLSVAKQQQLDDNKEGINNAQKRIGNKEKEIEKLDIANNEKLSPKDLKRQNDLQEIRKAKIKDLKAEARTFVERAENAGERAIGFTQDFKDADPEELFESLLNKRVQLNKPKGFQNQFINNKLDDARQGVSRFIANNRPSAGGAGNAVSSFFNPKNSELVRGVSSVVDSTPVLKKAADVGGKAVGKVAESVSGLGKGIFAVGRIATAVLPKLMSFFINPVTVALAAAAAALKFVDGIVQSEKVAKQFAERLNGDTDTVVTYGDMLGEINRRFNPFAKGFETAAKSANGLWLELVKIKNELGDIFNGENNLQRLLNVEFDRNLKDIQSYNNIEGAAAEKRINKVDVGIFQDVVVDDKKENVGDFLSKLDKNKVSREDSTKFADIVDKTRISLAKEKNTLTDRQTKIDDGVKAREESLTQFQNITTEEVQAFRNVSKFKQVETDNKDLLTRYDQAGRNDKDFKDEEKAIINQYNTLKESVGDSSNQALVKAFEAKSKEESAVGVIVANLEQLDKASAINNKRLEKAVRQFEDNSAILDTINIYIKNQSDFENTTNPFATNLKKGIDDGIKKTKENIKLYEKLYDSYIEMVNRKGKQIADAGLTEEERKILTNFFPENNKQADKILADTALGVEKLAITAKEGADKIRELLNALGGGGIDSTKREELIQQERALRNAQFETNVNFLEKTKALYENYANKELLFNEEKFRKLQQLELRQYDQKIAQAQINYAAIANDDGISNEEKQSRKIEIDILVDKRQVRELEQAIELLQKQNEIKAKSLSINKQLLQTSRNDELYITQKINDDIRKIDEQTAQLKIDEAVNYYNTIKDNDKVSKEEILTAEKEIAVAKEELNQTVFDNERKRREESLRLFEASYNTTVNKLFLAYATGNSDVYDELFAKQEQQRAKTLEAEIVNLNKLRDEIEKKGEDTTLIDEQVTSRQKELVAEYYSYAQALLNRYQANINNGVEKQNIALNRTTGIQDINKQLLNDQLDALQQQLGLVEQVNNARQGDIEYAKDNTASRTKQIKLEKQLIKEQREALTQRLAIEEQSLKLKQAVRDIELEILKIQQQQNEIEKEAAYKVAVADDALVQTSGASKEEKEASTLRVGKSRSELEGTLKQGVLLQSKQRLNDNLTATENYGLRATARQEQDALREREVANTSYKTDDVRYANERLNRPQLEMPVLQGVGDIAIDNAAVTTKLDAVAAEASKNAKVIVDGYQNNVNKLKDPLVAEQSKSNEWLKKIYDKLSGEELPKQTTNNTSTSTNKTTTTNNTSSTSVTSASVNNNNSINNSRTAEKSDNNNNVSETVKPKQQQGKKNTVYISVGYVSPDVRNQLGIGAEGSDGRKTDPKTGLALDPAFGWTEEYMPLKKKQGDLNRETDKLWAQYNNSGKYNYEQVQKMAEKNVGWTTKDEYDSKWRMHDLEEKRIQKAKKNPRLSTAERQKLMAEEELQRLRRKDAEARVEKGYTMFDPKGYEMDDDTRSRMNIMRSIVEGRGLILDPEKKIIEQERAKGGKNNPYLLPQVQENNIVNNPDVLKKNKKTSKVEKQNVKKANKVVKKVTTKPTTIPFSTQGQNIQATNVRVYGKPLPVNKVADKITAVEKLTKLANGKVTIRPRDEAAKQAEALAQKVAPSEAFIKRLQGSAYDINNKLENLDVQLANPNLSKQQRDKLRKDKIALKTQRDVTIAERDKPKVQQPKVKEVQPQPQQPVAPKVVTPKPSNDKVRSGKTTTVKQKQPPINKQARKRTRINYEIQQLDRKLQGGNILESTRRNIVAEKNRLTKQLNDTYKTLPSNDQRSKGRNVVVPKDNTQQQRNDIKNKIAKIDNRLQDKGLLASTRRIMEGEKKRLTKQLNKPKQTKNNQQRSFRSKPYDVVGAIMGKPKQGTAKNSTNVSKAKPKPQRKTSSGTAKNTVTKTLPKNKLDIKRRNLSDQIEQLDIRLEDKSLNAATRRNIMAEKNNLTRAFSDTYKKPKPPQPDKWQKDLQVATGQKKVDNAAEKQRQLVETKQKQAQTDRKKAEDRNNKVLAQQAEATRKREADRIKKLTPSERKLEDAVKSVSPSFKQKDTGVYNAPGQPKLQAVLPPVEKQKRKVNSIESLRKERMARVEKRNADLAKQTTPTADDTANVTTASNITNSNNIAFAPQITINVSTEQKELAKDVKEQVNDALFTLFNEVQRRQQA